jgi:hypothetical protein
VGVLRDRRFRRLLIGNSVSSFGSSALYLSLGIWAKDLTGSNAAAGGVFLAFGMPGLVGPVAGYLVASFIERLGSASSFVRIIIVIRSSAIASDADTAAQGSP